MLRSFAGQHYADPMERPPNVGKSMGLLLASSSRIRAFQTEAPKCAGRKATDDHAKTAAPRNRRAARALRNKRSHPRRPVLVPCRRLLVRQRQPQGGVLAEGLG